MPQKKRSEEPKLIRHFVFIEAPIDIVAELALDWGRPIWWPKDIGMNYAAVADMPLAEGRTYRIQFVNILRLTLSARVAQYLAGRQIEHQFISGILRGGQTITLEERSNGTRVDIVTWPRAHGFFNTLLWKVFFVGAYNRWIDRILATIKGYSETIFNERRETV